MENFFINLTKDLTVNITQITHIQAIKDSNNYTMWLSNGHSFIIDSHQKALIGY